jgi:hypothetical protein
MLIHGGYHWSELRNKTSEARGVICIRGACLTGKPNFVRLTFRDTNNNGSVSRPRFSQQTTGKLTQPSILAAGHRSQSSRCILAGLRAETKGGFLYTTADCQGTHHSRQYLNDI